MVCFRERTKELTSLQHQVFLLINKVCLFIYLTILVYFLVKFYNFCRCTFFLAFSLCIFGVYYDCMCGSFITDYLWYVKNDCILLYIYFEASCLTYSLNSSRSFPGLHRKLYIFKNYIKFYWLEIILHPFFKYVYLLLHFFN